MNNLTKILSIAVLGLTVAVGTTSVSAAPLSCQVTDVTNNPGANFANACVDHSGNNMPNYQNDINSDFGLSLNWSYIADDALATAGSSGSWDFTSYTMSNPFVIVLKAGPNFAAYLFNQASNGTGTWDTSNLPTNGNNPIDISHLSLYTSVGQVPVPAALWLFAPALLGLMGFRRRNNKA